jgi:hypothetical protein
MLTARAKAAGDLERIVITTGDGTVYDLGNPGDRMYPIRLRLYKFKRRREMRAQNKEN